MPYRNKEDLYNQIKRWRKNNPEKVKESGKRYRKNNLEKIKEHRKQYREKNHEAILEYGKQYRERNREEIKEKGRQYSRTEKARENAKINRFKYVYGLSHEDWLKMWEEQDERCSICEEPFTSLSDACVDHNHKTDEIRGLLCKKCNSAIGLLNDDPELMLKAIKYLAKNI